MKKTMIIALLAVLVLGAFTACNGDVNAELMGKRVITLEIDEEFANDLKFDDNSTTKTVEIPSNCKTWGNLANTNECTIQLKHGDYEANTYTLVEKSGTVCFSYGFQEVRIKAKYIEPSIGSDIEIAVGSKYVLFPASM